MQEIREIKYNGFNVVSTFSGAGGSCTGYRMAGFKVLWANEFVPAAQDSYLANCEKDCYLDKRDIKDVQPEEILKQTGLSKGEIDIFDGSPPCQAFSMAGKRAKHWGKEKKYEHGAKQCNEQLFDEYIRLLRGLMPKIFIAENVSGLLKGVAKGMFLEILRGLKKSGYNVKCKLLDAQWLGVPQMRQRAIFIGVRNDLGLTPVYPKPLKYRYSVKDAISYIISIPQVKAGFGDQGQKPSNVPHCNIGTSPDKGNGYARFVEIETSIKHTKAYQQYDQMKRGEHSYQSKRVPKENQPYNTIDASSGISGRVHNNLHHREKRKLTIAELKRICAFPDDFILTGSYSQQWERLGNSVPPVMMFHIAKEVKSLLNGQSDNQDK